RSETLRPGDRRLALRNRGGCRPHCIGRHPPPERVTLASRTVAAEPRVPRRAQLWGPFAFRDFRLIWIGMVFANFGSWMQFTALGYYVAKLAPNVAVGSFYIGLIGLSRMVPVLLCSPIAGVVADCFPRRRTLLITNAVLTVLGAALAVVTW